MAKNNLIQNNNSSMNDVVKITCYGVTKKQVRKEAMMFYLECLLCSEGAEQERYANVLRQLFMGKMECNDLEYC